MKIKILLLSACLITFKLCAQIPTTGLVGWYPMNGNANDESGNGNNGVVITATLAPDRFNHTDSAYYFNGSASIDCGNAAILNIDECTFSVWVKPEGFSGYQTLLAKYDVNFAGSYALSLNGNRANIWFTNAAGGNVNFNSNTTLAANYWYHIVATHSVSAGVKLYINGILDNQDATQFNVLQAPNDQFRIGSQGPFYPVPLVNGTLDDIRVYNVAIDQASIYQMYNESECNQTIYDTIVSTITVYDTLTTQVTVYDTLTTNITVYDTMYIAVTDTLIINALLTGIAPPNNINTIKIFPNPTSSNLFIDFGNFNLMNGYTLKIDNSLGQTVYTTPISQQQNNINLSTWTGNGTYFVYVIDNFLNTVEVKKIILQ